MRTLIICAVVALAMAACQRSATGETAEAPAAIDAATDASATDAGRDVAPSSSTSSPGSRSTSGSGSGSGASTAGDTMESAPANEGMMSGPSPEVRDAAKEKAEETNLHPSN